MRATRLERFKRQRHASTKKLLFVTVLVPSVILAAGYIISSLLIIPAMTK